VFLGGNNRYH